MLQKSLRKSNIWFFDYNDLATQTTPISVTWWAGYVDLTNDWEWPQTNKDNAPVWITDIFNVETWEFDFSQLLIWDMVDIRLDIEVTTAWHRQVIDVIIDVAILTVSNFSTHFLTSTYLKSAWTYSINEFIGWYIWNDYIRNNPAKIKIKSDWDCTVKVNGWYCKVIPRIK